jgi:hypothetical protein
MAGLLVSQSNQNTDSQILSPHEDQRPGKIRISIARGKPIKGRGEQTKEKDRKAGERIQKRDREKTERERRLKRKKREPKTSKGRNEEEERREKQPPRRATQSPNLQPSNSSKVSPCSSFPRLQSQTPGARCTCASDSGQGWAAGSSSAHTARLDPA